MGYFSAGTIEGLLSDDGEYFFLEMNTRVQVEHCVTEMVTGIDIVREQIKIAAGEDLAFGQDDIQLRGHAIECRINAETAATNFAPAPGQITHYVEPSGPGVRVDSGAREGYEVLPLYDPMIAKLICWDIDREASTRRMIRALSEYEIGGLTTLIGFHSTLMDTDQWRAGETCRDLVEDQDWLKALAEPTARGRRRRRGREGRARLLGRGVGPQVRRQGHRRGVRRRRGGRPGQRRGRAPRPSAASARSPPAAGPTRSPHRSRATCGRSWSPRATRSKRASCSASSRR